MNHHIPHRRSLFSPNRLYIGLLILILPLIGLAAEDPGETAFKRLFDTPEDGWKRLNDHFLNGREKSLETVSGLYAFKFSKDPRFLVAKGTLETLSFFKDRNLSRATNYFDQANRTTPESLYQKAASLALPILHGDKELPASFNQLETLVDQNPQEPLLRLLFATLAYKISTEDMKQMTRDDNEVIQLSLYHYRVCLKAWNQNDGGAKINANIAALIESRGCVEEELKHRVLVEKYDPTPTSIGEVALGFAMTGKAKEGLEKLDQLFKDHPKNYYTHYYRIQYFKYLDQVTEAYAACQAGLAHHPNTSRLWEEAGRLEERLTKPSDAEKSYTKALEFDKDKGYPRRRLRYLYETRGAYDDAWKLEQEKPRNPKQKLSSDIYFRAIEQNREKEVEALLQKNPELLNKPDPEDANQTPLMKATQWGATRVALLLMERGADLKALDNYRCNLAHYACYHGRTFLLEKYLDQGVDPWVINKNNYYAPNIGVNHSHPECVQSLIKKLPVEKYPTEYTSVFIMCAGWNQFEQMKILNKNGITFDQADPETGETPLMRSARWGQCNIIHYLLKNNASASIIDKKSQNALHYLFENKKQTPNIEIYRRLIQAGANPEQPNKEGKTPTQLLNQSIAKKFFE